MVKGGVASVGMASGARVAEKFGKKYAPVGAFLGAGTTSLLCTGSFHPIMMAGLTAWAYRDRIREYFKKK